jgi:hypothetical protein
MKIIRYTFILLFIAFGFATGCKKESSDFDEYSSADFENLWGTTDMYYPFFGLKHINRDSIYTVYQPRFVNITTSEKRDLLGQLLNELKDGHANLISESGRYLSSYDPPRAVKDENAFSLGVVRQYFMSELIETAGIFSYGILPGNKGYVYISSFPSDESTYLQFDTVLEFVKETEVLIIDIRHNGGGSTNSCNYFISRLIDNELEGVLWTQRGGGYRPVSYYYPAGDFQYTNNTALLINGKTFSTAESMANLCKKIEHITLIGDTTGGGGGVPDEIFVMPSGLKFRVPTRCEMRYDGEYLEWNGIPPDILIPQTKENIDNNRDLQLEAALNYLGS